MTGITQTTLADESPFQVSGSVIPQWIKNNAGWWSQGQIEDNQFVKGIQYLIQKGMIQIPITPVGSSSETQQIPSWIKNNAGWWADGQISDDEFVKGIQYMIQNGILKVQQTSQEISSQSIVPSSYNHNTENQIQSSVNYAITSTIQLGNGSGSIALNSITNKIYATNLADNTLSVIDGSTKTINTIPVCNQPSGVAVNPITNKIYVAGWTSSILCVIDGSTNKVISTIGIDDKFPVSIAVNPTTNLLYVVNIKNNSISVIDGSTNTITTTISVGYYPNGVTVDPTTNTVYVTNGGDNDISVINGLTNTVTSIIPVGKGPIDVAVNPITNKIYVDNFLDKSISVIDGLTNAVTGTISLGGSPRNITVNPTNNMVYYVIPSTNSLDVMDGSTNTVKFTMQLNQPVGGSITINPTTNVLYATNVLKGNTLSIISPVTEQLSSPVIMSSTSSVNNNQASEIVGVKNMVNLSGWYAISHRPPSTTVGGCYNLFTRSCFSIQQNFEIDTPSQPDHTFTYWAQNVILIQQNPLDGSTQATSAFQIWKCEEVNGCIIPGQLSSVYESNDVTKFGVIGSPHSFTLQSYISGDQLVMLNDFGQITPYQLPSGSYLNLDPQITEPFPELVLVGQSGGDAAMFGPPTNGQVQSCVQLSNGEWTNAVIEYVLTTGHGQTKESSSGLEWTLNGNTESFDSPNNENLLTSDQGISFGPSNSSSTACSSSGT